MECLLKMKTIGQLLRIRGSILFVIIVFALPVWSMDDGFVSLFDGKSLDGWQLIRAKGPGYVVKDGLLVCPRDGGGNLYTEKEYANFVFRFEFRLHEGSNNGVGIRAPLEGDAAYQGMEIQILDNQSDRYRGKLRPSQYHGSIYDVFPARLGYLEEVGEWNEEEIRAEGYRITVLVNGQVVVDADLRKVKDLEVLKRHPGLARKTGHVGFLGHGEPIEFRNIKIKELP